MISANSITISRIILSPILCFLLLNQKSFEESLISVILFILIFSTDWIDGFLARRTKVSNLGKIIDPVADKIFVFSVMICLIYINLLSVWPFIIILFRDLLMSSVRIFLAKNNIVCAANVYGKIKTCTQFLSLLFFLLNRLPYLNSTFYMVSYILGTVFIWISAILSFISFFECIRMYKSELKKIISE